MADLINTAIGTNIHFYHMEKGYTPKRLAMEVFVHSVKITQKGFGFDIKN